MDPRRHTSLALRLACSLLLALLATPASGQFDVDFTGTPTMGDNPLTVSFSGISTAPATAFWVWDFGDGEIASGTNLDNVTHTFFGPGISFTVSLRVSQFPQTDIETKLDYITVDPGPLVADFSASPTAGVLPLTVMFTDESAANGPSWLWDFGDGSTSTLQNPTHQYTGTGNYTVSLTAFVGSHSDTHVKTDHITVDPAPLVVDFDASPDQGVNPLTVSFTDTSTGATTTAWSWDFGDGNTSTEQNPVHTYTLPGSYTVSLTASVFGQSDTLVQTDLITVDPAPLVVDFDVSSTQGVAPLLVAFTDTTTGTPPTAWLWDFGDGTTSTLQNPTHAFSTVGSPTSFTVSLTAFVGQQSDTEVRPELITVEPLFGTPQVISTAALGASDVHTADLDGDGDLDVLAASTVIAWYENTNGQGSFGPQQVIAPSAGTLVTADLDGDGDLDVISTADEVLWYENTDGLGGFGPPRVITGLIFATRVQVEDMDGDGDADVVVVDGGDEYGNYYYPAWYENADGLGNFGQSHFLDGIAPILVTDMNGDGTPDVVSAHGGGPGYVGEFLGFLIYGPLSSIRAADIDGDGDQDVFASGTVAYCIPQGGGGPSWCDWMPGDAFSDWYLNDGQGGLTGAGLGPGFDESADLDADGDVDLLSASGGQIAWFKNEDGLGSFGPAGVLQDLGSDGKDPFAIPGAGDVHAADLDGDGDLDVLTAASIDNQIAWFENLTGPPPECFLVIGDAPGSSPYAGPSHVFTTQVGPTVEDSYFVLMEDIPEFVLPETISASSPMAQGGAQPPRRVTRPVSPGWLRDGQACVQVLMWNPGVFPALPEQCSAGLLVQIHSGGVVSTAPYGTPQGGIEVWSEVTTNTHGQKVIRFPFSIEGF